MRCPTCGAAYPTGGVVCTRDGARLVPVGGATRASPREVAPPLRPPGAKAPPKTRWGGAGAGLEGTLLDGQYRVERKIGEGGMSLVYLATDEASGVRYAIKVLSPLLSHDANAMARLRREARFGARLAHPNVCHIEKLGETRDGLVYVVMPYVEGDLLADVAYRMGTVPLTQALVWVAEIASGLEVAHRLGIVHRDLKPENVMISGSDGEAGGDRSEGGRAVVLDFGLAKERTGAEMEKLTATGVILGTPEFMSPEQLRGRVLDGRSDVYSLALVTYEMLTGRLPFNGRTQQEQMVARLRADPLALRTMRPELNYPEGLERALLRGVARDPDDRYATAPEFARGLIAGLEWRGEPGGFLARWFGR